MVSLEQKIKEYVSSVEIPDRVKPEEIRRLLEDNGDMTAGVFLRKLKELKISGSDFLELLGNSKIGNMEFRRIEENPHLKFDELLQILDNSVLSGEDYRMIIAVATQRKELAEQRKRREEETLRRMTEELTAKRTFIKKKKQEQIRKIQPIYPKIHPKQTHRKHSTVRRFLRLRHLFSVCRKKLTAKKMSKL